MSELFIKYRIKFKKSGVQRDFITNSRNLINITWYDFSKKLGINQRTLRDWVKEKYNIPYDVAQLISKLSGVSIPIKYKIIDGSLNKQKAGIIGGRNHFIKYGNVGGNETYRKSKWKEWWENIGQYKENPKGFQSLIKIKKPSKSKKLAEFVGIMLGDGGISKYNVKVTLGSNEKEYIKYVSDLINKLFNIVPKIYPSKIAQAVNIVSNRKELVVFCQSIGLVVGNKIKQQIDIPLWIKKNKTFTKECIRGLIDTDGCFFTHKYISSGKRYYYLKIAFTSASRPLVLSVAKTLTNFGFKVRISKNGKDVRIEDNFSVQKYIKEIGSNNQKHLDKIIKWKVALNGKAAVC